MSSEVAFKRGGFACPNLSADQEVAWHLARIGGEECCVRRGLAQRGQDKSQIIYGSKCWTYIIWLNQL